MTFRVAQETLDALEWDRITESWREHCRTSQGRAALEKGNFAAEQTGSDSLFEVTLRGVSEKIQETNEARALLDQELLPPMSQTADLDTILGRASRGGLLEPKQIMDVRQTLESLSGTRLFLLTHLEAAPRLADLAGTIEIPDEIVREIDRCMDSAGEIRDRASSELAEARKESIRLSSQLQQRLDRSLRDSEITRHLSDNYYTMRNDRYVLPVKAHAKSHIRGIVHDASRSGTTLFIEPEAVVELNNRLKQTDLLVRRAIERILLNLSGQIAGAAEAIHAGLVTLATIDLAFARGHLSQDMEATAPEVGEEGIFELPMLRHPLISPEHCVANDLRLGADFTVLVLSGPNAGGKTVTLKAIALAALFVRAGLHVPAAPGCRVDLVSDIIAEIGDHQDIGENLSTFSAHMANLADVVSRASHQCLIVLDEIGVGTDPGEGSTLAQSILEVLAERGARVVTTTHYNLLKEMADVDERFENGSVEFEPETLAPTYHVKLGIPGASSAAAVAARMGMPSHVLERADSLLQRDDRRLEKMLSELASNRAALAREHEVAKHLKAEGEAARNEYRTKLERLQQRRDGLFKTMREDLERAFKDAHHEVASVIRELQRAPSSRNAAEARQILKDLEERAEEPDSTLKKQPESAATLTPIDWRKAQPGDRVRMASGMEATLEILPDKKGKVGLTVSGKRLFLPSEQVGRLEEDIPDNSRKQVIKPVRESQPQAQLEGGTAFCDLRGERVEAALDQLTLVLDRALADGRDALRVVHGLGTGALQKAVRESLAQSPYVRAVESVPREDGGEAVTLALLR